MNDSPINPFLEQPLIEDAPSAPVSQGINPSLAAAAQKGSASIVGPTKFVSLGGMQMTPEVAATVLGYEPELGDRDAQGNRIVIERDAQPAEVSPEEPMAQQHQVSASMELAALQLQQDGYEPEMVEKISDIIADQGGLTPDILAQLEDQGTSTQMVKESYGRIEAEQTKAAKDVLGRPAFQHLFEASAHRPELRGAIFRHGMQVARGRLTASSWNDFYQQHFPSGSEG